MSDNELDNLFKEAAEGFKVPSDPSAWQDMSGKLDQAATVTSFWNWKTIASLTLVGVTSTALILYLSAPGSTVDKIAASHITLNQAIEKKPTDSKPASSDTETNGTSQNQKDKNELAIKENDQNRSDTPSVETGANSESSVNKNSVESLEAVKSEEVQSSASKQNSLSSKQMKEEQVNAQYQSDKTASPEISKEKITSSENKSGQVASIAAVAVIGKSLDTKSPNGSAVNEQNSTQVLNSKGSTVQTESLAVADSLEKLDEEKQVTTVEKKVSENEEPEKKEESESINKFAIKLAFAPDYTTVKSVTPNGMGINYGVLFEYRFNNHLSVATGGIWTKKIYSATDVEYNGYTADRVDGDCRMWDIPINVYYNFSSRKPFSFYASVGLSSYLMNEENYVFYVETPYGEYAYPKQIKGKNNEWFKTLNVSVGMQYRMSQRFLIQFEPTLKAPLAGVGEGEVSLVSLGAFLNLRFDIPLNKPVRNDD